MSVVTYTCKICGKEIKSRSVKIFESHLSECHNISFIEYIREYYPEKNGYCLVCGKPTEYRGKFSAGFNKTCSKECSDIQRLNSLKGTNLEKYGVEFYSDHKKASETWQTKSETEIQQIQEKKRKTNLEKYGCENTFQAEQFKEKASKTKLEKYGSETYNNRDKAKETWKEIYGVEHPLLNPEIKKKAQETLIYNHGVDNPFQSNDILTKIKETNLEKYGVEFPFQSNTIQDKCKKAHLTNYGYEIPSKNNLIREKISKSRKMTRYDFLKSQLLKFKNIELLDTKEKYVSNETHRYFCEDHGEFLSAGTNLQHVSCPICSKEPRSNLEKEVVEFISKYVPTVEISNRTVLSGKELDILITSKNLAIEFDGLYWHSNLYKEKNYHLEKTEQCGELNIQLIHIFENEWLNKRPIVESVLLAKLGIFQKRIYGRKCEVKSVSQELYREFVELNHLQGYVPAKLILGLFHEDELVEVCSFGKSRFKSREMELLRHCSLLNTQIIGGFSKLIKAWKKLNPNEDLYTYCDRRYSTGKSYEASGWTKVSESAPNYFYISKTGLESRIKYQKHKLKDILSVYDESLTEQENMSVNGFTWIYDCGNLKYKI
jgi:hypothetical protein